MRGHVAVALGVLTAVVSAGAAIAARPKDPTFRLTLTSKIAEHEVTHIVKKQDPLAGCRWRTDSDVRDTIMLSSEKPVDVHLSDLVGGGVDLVRLSGRETRGGSYWDGWEAGCPLLTGQPAFRSITSGCGTRRFDVSQSLTAVGYASPSTENFRVKYGGLLPDPFRGRCLPTGENALSLAFPPIEWLQPPTKRNWWVRVSRAKFLTGKPVVVTWKDARTFTHPGTLDPGAFDQTESSVTYSLSWTVKLVPVKA